MKGTLKGFIQLLCNEQGHLYLDQVAQSPVQPAHECLQGWGIHYLPGQPVTAYHPYCKKLLSYTQPKSPLF